MTFRPKPDDIELLTCLIEMRDSAHLAGHRNDVFRLSPRSFGVFSQ
jgi:hypothetical protein